MSKTKTTRKNKLAPKGRYADLTNNFAFQKVFANEKEKSLLVTTLNIFFEKKLAYPIKDVVIKNPYIQGETKYSRNSVLDIRCEDTGGNKFIVEMQVNSQKHFIKRSIFYSSMSIASSGKKGEDWDFDFPNVYSLNFLDFEPKFADKRNDVVRYLSLHDDDYPEIRYDYTGFAFVMLPKFNKSLEECVSLHDKLLFTLRNAHKLKSRPKQLRGKFFDRLFKLAKFSTFTKMEFSQYTSRMMARADRKAQLEYAREEGIEQGITQGISQGITQGISQGIIETAKSMLKEGLDFALVARITKLPKKQVMALR
ncbi:MAG: Rpn family recombination-promoting nuclease/putative transposase [Fibromonadaceae bacterium]|nr:Rpn family recombination-promoting nuclease/putative transposase [Fibromonadaceae bacterium]